MLNSHVKKKKKHQKPYLLMNQFQARKPTRGTKNSPP